MPWKVTKGAGCPEDKPWAVVSESGRRAGCHASKAGARRQMNLLYMKLKRGEIK